MNPVLPPQRHRSDAWTEHQDPVIQRAQNKMEEGRKEGRREGKKEGRKIGR